VLTNRYRHSVSMWTQQSYANVRRFLSKEQLPPRAAVADRGDAEYFSYDYPGRAGMNCPLRRDGPSARESAHRLALVGLKAKDVAAQDAQPDELVFSVDVSGSWPTQISLPLVKQGMRCWWNQLNRARPRGHVVYAAMRRWVLPVHARATITSDPRSHR